MSDLLKSKYPKNCRFLMINTSDNSAGGQGETLDALLDATTDLDVIISNVQVNAKDLILVDLIPTDRNTVLAIIQIPEGTKVSVPKIESNTPVKIEIDRKGNGSGEKDEKFEDVDARVRKSIKAEEDKKFAEMRAKKQAQMEEQEAGTVKPNITRG